ncbi:MAG: hypothetical protein WCE94_12500 [Candidatus Methanoperedens sp.]
MAKEPEKTPFEEELLAELSKHNESLERVAESLEKIEVILSADFDDEHLQHLMARRLR